MEQQMSQTTRSDVLPTILSLSDVSDEPKYSKSKIAILPVSDDSEQRLWDRVATSLANVAVSSTSTRSDPAIGDIGVIVAGAFLDIQHDDAFIRFSNADSPDSITIELIPSSPANKLMPPLDEEIMDMCKRNNLTAYVDLLDGKIRELYHSVKEIRHKILPLPDPSFPERLIFEIHLSNKPEQILREEKVFRQTFFAIAPEDKQEFFSFTYRII